MNINKRKSTIFGAMAIILAIFFTVFAGEIVLRILGYQPNIIKAEMFSWSEDPLLPHRLRPGYADHYVGKKVTVGNDGLRIVPGGAVASPDASVTLIVGDSVAFGQGLNDDQTIAAQLAQRVKNRKDMQIRMLAAPGYTSWNEYRAVETYKGLGSVSNIVLIYVPNDLTTDNNHFKQHNGKISYIKSEGFRAFIQWMYAHLRISFLVSSGVKKVAGLFSAPPGPGAAGAESDAKALGYSMEAIAKLRDLCTRRGIRLTVAVYRDLWIYSDKTTVEAYEALVSNALQQIDVDHFILRRHTDKLSLEKARGSWNDLHPNAAAAKLLAEQISYEIGLEKQPVSSPVSMQ